MIDFPKDLNSLNKIIINILSISFQYLNIPKYSVMGWSAGGSASMILAAQHPDNIKKLVLWGTSSFTHPDDLDTYKSVFYLYIRSRGKSIFVLFIQRKIFFKVYFFIYL